jgi:hypothetical protein
MRASKQRKVLPHHVLNSRQIHSGLLTLVSADSRRTFWYALGLRFLQVLLVAMDITNQLECC